MAQQGMNKDRCAEGTWQHPKHSVWQVPPKWQVRPVVDVERGEQQDVGHTHAGNVQPGPIPPALAPRGAAEGSGCECQGPQDEQMAIVGPPHHGEDGSGDEHDQQAPVVYGRPPAGWRPGRLPLTIATMPATTQIRPAGTWMERVARKTGSSEGMGMPSTTISCPLMSLHPCDPGHGGHDRGPLSSEPIFFDFAATCRRNESHSKALATMLRPHEFCECPKPNVMASSRPSPVPIL